MFRALSFYLFLLLSFSCSNPKEKKQILPINKLAEVGGKTITTNDFLKRCEYVPRPSYCRDDNYIHKKIALNSIIAEKILALEFEKNDLKFTDSQNLLIKGQKEQAMRHLMLKKLGYQKVIKDTAKISLLSKLSKRTYEINFLILSNKEWKIVSKNKNNFESLTTLAGKLSITNRINKKVISESDNMINDIRNRLFSDHQNTNELYGPFKTMNSEVVFFEIFGWRENPNITEKQKQESWGSAEKKYYQTMALEIYSLYVKNIMQGKSIQYNPIVFKAFSDKLSKIYLIDKKRKEAVIQNKLWELNNKEELVSFDQIKNMKNQHLLTHDGEKYSVEQILNLIKSHPLVFRNKKTNPNLFSRDLKHALADLFRDYHITKKAYELGYDKEYEVLSVEQKWSDYIKSVKHNKTGFNVLERPKKEMVKKIDSLKIIYSDLIKIDTDKFEKTQLTKTDMNVIYSNQAYAQLEPPFPLLTENHLLDYGQKVTFDD